MDGLADKVKAAGGLDMLTKPFKKDNLLDLVAKYMPGEDA